MTNAQRRRDAIKAWWNRKPWPCILLAVDPGRKAGAALMQCNPDGITLLWHGPIDTHTRDVEKTTAMMLGACNASGLPGMLAVEEWGKGGPMGLQHWIGLGEARGAWTREFNIWSNEKKSLFRKGGIVKVHQGRWRGRIIEEKLPRLDTREERQEQLKEAAARAAQNYFIDQRIDIDPDACEAVCIGLFAARSDALGKKLTKTHLKKHGLTFEPLEETIRR